MQNNAIDADHTIRITTGFIANIIFIILAVYMTHVKI